MAFSIPLTLIQVLLVFVMWTGLEMPKIEKVHLVDASSWGTTLFHGLVRRRIRSLSPQLRQNRLEPVAVALN